MTEFNEQLRDLVQQTVTLTENRVRLEIATFLGMYHDEALNRIAVRILQGAYPKGEDANKARSNFDRSLGDSKSDQK
jgi:hypothetical protein